METKVYKGIVTEGDYGENWDALFIGENSQPIAKTFEEDLEANYNDAYSECTGYLWTDENLNVGGHDLLEEIRSYLGKFIYLEVDVH